MSTEERIKQDAIQIAKDELDNNKPYPSWEYLIEKGALSERNKVIEEIREEIDNVLFKRKMHNDTWANGYYTALHDVLGAMNKNCTKTIKL